MDAKRVVIIDDEMVLGQLLQAAFATLSGHIEVSVVPNAEEASKELNRSEIHLVVADVKLPGISGLEFAAQLKKKSPQIKIILVSGLNDSNLKEKALAAGADAFFPKPVEMHGFLEASSRLLGIVSQTSKLSPRQVIDIRSDLFIDLLINLRQDLSAIAVTMINESGKVVGSAGDPPEENLANNVIPYLLSVSSTIQRLNGSLQPEVAENVVSFRGGQYDLLVAPINGFLLLVFLKHARSSVRMAVAFDSLVTSMGELQKQIDEIGNNYPVETHPTIEKILSQTGPLKMPETAQAAEQKVEERSEEKSTDFDHLFTAITRKKLKTEEVDSFWETATDKASFSDTREPGLLSFEEASHLGLTPKEEEAQK
jgi:CheY-like chemotaxis protein